MTRAQARPDVSNLPDSFCVPVLLLPSQDPWYTFRYQATCQTTGRAKIKKEEASQLCPLREKVFPEATFRTSGLNLVAVCESRGSATCRRSKSARHPSRAGSSEQEKWRARPLGQPPAASATLHDSFPVKIREREEPRKGKSKQVLKFKGTRIIR